jgi:hypothetical protein
MQAAYFSGEHLARFFGFLLFAFGPGESGSPLGTTMGLNLSGVSERARGAVLVTWRQTEEQKWKMKDGE